MQVNEKQVDVYSYFSNNREFTLTDFENKFFPLRTFPNSMFIDLLDFFHPPLLGYCSYVQVFFTKNPALQA